MSPERSGSGAERSGSGAERSEDVEALIAAYAVGALDAGERAAVEAHLRRSPEAAHRAADLLDAAAAWGAAAPVDPPPAMRGRVMAAIGAVEQLPPRAPAPRSATAAIPGQRRPLVAVLAAAAVALVLAAGAVGGWQVLGGNRQPSELAGARERIAAAPDAVVVDPAEESAAQWAGTEVVFSPSEGEAVLISTGPLRELEDRVYALWAIHDDGSVAPAGTFRGGSGAVLDGELDDVSAVAVTIEPRPGLAAPTTPVVARYELSV